MSDGAPAGAIALGLGEPTWPMHGVAVQALAATHGVCSYGPQGGRPELIEAIASYHGARAEQILVTVGAQEAMNTVAQSYLGPGDAALVPDPGFVGYRGVVQLAGAEAVAYPLDASQGFDLCADRLIEVLDRTPNARVVFLCSPSNPTGGGASLRALKAVARACEKRDVLVVSDEVYRELHLGPRPASLRDATDSGLVLQSMSKGFAAPGLRVGWVFGEPERIAPLRISHGYGVTTAATPAQLAAAALLENASEVLAASQGEVRVRFEALREAAGEFLGSELTLPAGGFYHFLPLPEAAHGDPFAWCLQLRDKAGVVLVPGLAFGEAGRGHARLSFAAPPDSVREGVKRFAGFCASPSSGTART